MKFQTDRDTLADAVGWAARALPARPAAPILAGMQMTVTSHLTLSTFDYEMSARATVPLAGDATPGTALVSGRLLAEIVKALPSRPVEVTTDDSGRVSLTCGAAKFTLHALLGDEYPALPAVPPLAGTIGADLLASAISQVAVAAGRDDTLPALTGIRCEFDGDMVTLVATDRYRLAVRQFPWVPAVTGLEAAALVPARALTEAARSFGPAAEVAIGFTATGAQDGAGIIGWQAADRETTTRLLGGEFPRYQSLLPRADEFTATAELAVAPFAEAVKRVALVAERNTPVRLTFTTDGLLLEAGAGDEATALETLETNFAGGEDLRVNFNPQYLLDGLTAVSSDTALISFTTPTRPAVLTGKGEDGPPDYRYVLMPIRAAG